MLNFPSFTGIIIAFFMLLPQMEALAWGATGHRITGEVAEKYLTKKAKRNITKIIGNESLAMVTTFMDEIKSLPEYKHLDPWHYCTIPDGMTYEQAGTPEQGDAIMAIEKFIEELKTKQFSQGDEAFTLKCLVHLIGDIHQPLHVGRPGDRGGNDIEVEYFWKKNNLHRVWDSGMIDGTQLSYTEYTAWINHAEKGQMAQWQNSTVRDWAHESMTYREGVYDLPADGKINYAYDHRHLPTVNERLLQAGVRMAAVLNAIYG